MSKRSYDQFCPLAQSLDLVGERWTLLVVRDLLSGPKRYTDLQHGLEGIATDILTQRLRHLEAAGIVRRRELPPPSSSSVYELTERGQELEPALISLARFGFPLLKEPPAADEVPKPETFGLMLRVLFDPAGAAATAEAYAFQTADARIEVQVADGAFEVFGDGASAPLPPALTIHADATCIYELLIGRRDPEQAVNSGELRLEGPRAALQRLRRAFPAPDQVTATPA